MSLFPRVASSFPVVLALTLGAAVRAADLVVDPAGGPGTYPTIQAALVAAQPGDRVLVRPGVYGSISITKAIQVIGVGTVPGDVVVGGLHLGLGFPNQDYRVTIAHLRIDAGPLWPQAVSGQELGTGQIEFESVEVQGGFRLLAGEPGFVLSLANCTFAGDVGQGFDGATCHVAAPAPSYFAITRCRFQGARGDLFAAQPPLAGLLLDRGVTTRLEQCEIRGGRGGLAQAGAPGLHVRQAQVASLGTDSVIVGGDGGVGAAGGPGVRTTSTVRHGALSVTGGQGTAPGPAVTGGGALLANTAPELHLVVDDTVWGPAFARAGTELDWDLDVGTAPGVVLLSLAIGDPLPAPLDQLVLDPGASTWLPPTAAFTMPPLGAFVGLPLLLQGVGLELANGSYPATPPYALHLDG